jgi:acetyl/propionyl-CoA carboxylase alpha subunit
MAIGKIRDTAEAMGIEAIHPSDRIRAENPRFAQRCSERGLVFIGPALRGIEVMGSMLAARRRVRAGGVSVISNRDEPIPSAAGAQQIATRIGFPPLLEAYDGANGVPIHPVGSPEDRGHTFDSSRECVQRFYGEGTRTFEQSVPGARHLEVQAARDGHDMGVRLFERDRPTQRRHERVIERDILARPGRGPEEHPGAASSCRSSLHALSAQPSSAFRARAAQ